MHKIALAAAVAIAVFPGTAMAQDTDANSGAAVKESVQHEQRTEFGVLDCNIEGGVGLILGSSKNMTCLFNPTDGRPAQEFVGQVNKFGLDIGVTAATVMKWLVLAPTGSDLSAAALAGTYRGASAEATAGIGVGANVLLGGSTDSFALQPVSIQGQTGLNVALGVTSFKLVAVN